jgi:hypothetical protein
VGFVASKMGTKASKMAGAGGKKGGSSLPGAISVVTVPRNTRAGLTTQTPLLGFCAILWLHSAKPAAPAKPGAPAAAPAAAATSAKTAAAAAAEGGDNINMSIAEKFSSSGGKPIGGTSIGFNTTSANQSRPACREPLHALSAFIHD